MIPYHITFVVDDETSFSFDSNEKPVKGDLFTIEDPLGNRRDIRIKEVKKLITQSKDGNAKLHYQCQVENYDERSVAIGFMK